MHFNFISSKWWILFLIFSGTLINAIDRSSISVVNTVISQELHLSLGTMGMILSAFGWSYLIFNIPAGWFSDRFGAKKAYGIAATIWSLASAATGLAKGVSVLLISRIMVGVGEAANFPVATKLITEHFRKSERGLATGIYLSGLRLGFAITPPLMISLMIFFGSSANPNWRIPFFITGLGSLVWVGLWVVTYKEKYVNNYKFTKENQSGTKKIDKNKTTSVKSLLIYRNTWAIIIIKFLQDYLYYLFLTWLPGYLIKGRNMNLAQIAFYSTFPWVAGMLSQPLYGMLSDWLVRKNLNVTTVKKSLLVIAQLVSASVISAAYVHSAELAAWLLVVAMAGESASTAILWSIPQDLAPSGSAGSLGGIMNTAGAAASIVAPVLTGIVAQYFGFVWALNLGGFAILFALLCVLFLLGDIKQLPGSRESF